MGRREEHLSDRAFSNRGWGILANTSAIRPNSTPDRKSYQRLALIPALATWVPLTVLSVLGGAAFPGSVAEPFFEDITPHVRFLFALPVLIILARGCSHSSTMAEGTKVLVSSRVWIGRWNWDPGLARRVATSRGV